MKGNCESVAQKLVIPAPLYYYSKLVTVVYRSYIILPHFRKFKMDVEHFVWNARNGDIWEVANELQENAVHVDVYLQAVGNDPCNVKDMECKIFNRLPLSKEKMFMKNVTFPAHKLMLAAASPFLNKVWII